MKKFMMLMGFIVAMTSVSQVNAQYGSPYTFPTIAGDSLVNADTVFKKVVISAGYSKMGVQASIKKGTGTLDGKLYLYTSIEGGGYKLTDSASFTAMPAFATALANPGGFTWTAIIEKDHPAGYNYIVAVTQAGSLTSSPVKVSYTSRRHN